MAAVNAFRSPYGTLSAGAASQDSAAIEAETDDQGFASLPPIQDDQTSFDSTGTGVALAGIDQQNPGLSNDFKAAIAAQQNGSATASPASRTASGLRGEAVDDDDEDDDDDDEDDIPQGSVFLAPKQPAQVSSNPQGFRAGTSNLSEQAPALNDQFKSTTGAQQNRPAAASQAILPASATNDVSSASSPVPKAVSPTSSNQAPGIVPPAATSQGPKSISPATATQEADAVSPPVANSAGAADPPGTTTISAVPSTDKAYGQSVKQMVQNAGDLSNKGALSKLFGFQFNDSMLNSLKGADGKVSPSLVAGALAFTDASVDGVANGKITPEKRNETLAIFNMATSPATVAANQDTFGRIAKAIGA